MYVLFKLMIVLVSMLQVRISVSREDGLTLHMPPPYSIVIQVNTQISISISKCWSAFCIMIMTMNDDAGV